MMLCTINNAINCTYTLLKRILNVSHCLCFILQTYYVALDEKLFTCICTVRIHFLTL